MGEAGRRRVGSLAVALAILGLLAVTVVTLATAARPAPDRAQELSERLRCPVCKSVSIADSPSEMATAMRQVVAEQVVAGRTDREIVDFFRGRYGDWVLLDPPRRGSTLPLWLVPLAATALGVAVVLARVRRRDAPAVELAESARNRVEDAVARARAAGPGEEDEP
ncbi:cytochrome c-type biogenesis protein [Pseudonocardia kunmingensis]|uniref:Cytochrome c-type biogenesis protein n=1 Tax=Pseudonocardia kunmingensis TaxID=630975 RepID=A0A543DKL5_9PSEU|nr:cytochrome c-type biogenesis protein [Pseudonocardia kunmingensis]TQM09880.1 cytochrome c-type biogenesis protein CcmH [Pseudonocardia kunmingensis]